VTKGPTQAAAIEIEAVDDGFVVYDPRRDRVHFLNHTAAVILESCNGGNSVTDIAHMLQVLYGLPDAVEEDVLDCLAQLAGEGLVQGLRP
jgi:PqqD family protein of HPr-rel-A system